MPFHIIGTVQATHLLCLRSLQGFLCCLRLRLQVVELPLQKGVIRLQLPSACAHLRVSQC